MQIGNIIVKDFQYVCRQSGQIKVSFYLDIFSFFNQIRASYYLYIGNFFLHHKKRSLQPKNQIGVNCFLGLQIFPDCETQIGHQNFFVICQDTQIIFHKPMTHFSHTLESKMSTGPKRW